MDRDYIIAFDENGEPYIAHALGSRLSGAASNVRRAGSRYLMKIQTKYGNRYFYTPQEVQAYQRAKSGVKKAANSTKSAVNNTKKQVNQTVKTLKSDLKKRRTWKNAEKEASSNLKPLRSSPDSRLKRYESEDEKAYDKALAAATKKTYDKTKLGKAESAVKSATERMKEEFRKKKDDVKDAVEQKTGIQAKRELEKEKQNLRKAISKADRDEVMAIKAKRNAEYDSNGNEWYGSLNEAERAYEADLKAARSGNDTINAKRNVDGAQSRYDNSPLGKAEKAENAVKSATERMKEEFRKKANEAADKVKDKAGVDEKERYEEAQKAYDENDLNVKNLDAELSSKNISLQYYDSAMLKKYGKDYKSKMSKAEKEKYSKLDAERAALWEKYWNALINKYGAATGNDPTLKDQLDKAKAEYDNTLLGKLDRRKKK